MARAPPRYAAPRGRSGPLGTGPSATDFDARLTRHSEGGQLLETVFVAAIVTVHGVRFLLEVAGYPRLGGGGLHVAHLLWGGLLMLAGTSLMFLFLDRRVQYAAAVVSGVGFGLFIDELGKFVTADNNYFFRPAIALIYLVFVCLFLVLRSVSASLLDRREALANVLGLLVDGVDGSLEAQTRHRVGRGCSPVASTEDPLGLGDRRLGVDPELARDPGRLRPDIEAEGLAIALRSCSRSSRGDSRGKGWSRRSDLNRGPAVYETDDTGGSTLAASLTAPRSPHL